MFNVWGKLRLNMQQPGRQDSDTISKRAAPWRWLLAAGPAQASGAAGWCRAPAGVAAVVPYVPWWALGTVIPRARASLRA